MACGEINQILVNYYHFKIGFFVLIKMNIEGGQMNKTVYMAAIIKSQMARYKIALRCTKCYHRDILEIKSHAF